MNTEQVIYELNNHKKYAHYILLHKEVDNIIELLKRGEKCEKIIDKMEGIEFEIYNVKEIPKKDLKIIKKYADDLRKKGFAITPRPKRKVKQ